MGYETKIEWATHTFNPWRGCTKVSAGCTNCYAERQSHRNPKVLGVWGDGGTRVVASEGMWREPIRWAKAARADGERPRVFCASLADWLEDRQELVAPLARLLDLIHETWPLDWLLLTKRPENWRKRLESAYSAMPTDKSRRFVGSWIDGGIPGNVWVGTSVEDQACADERIPHLLKIPARVRFLSCEPLLVTVKLPEHLSRIDGPGLISHGDFRDWIHWVIVGGESGPKARPCDVAWIRSIRDQCKAAGVPCFIKQLGARPHWDSHGSRVQMNPTDPKGGDWSEWPEDLRVREIPTESNEPAPTCTLCGKPMSVVRPGKYECYRERCQVENAKEQR